MTDGHSLLDKADSLIQRHRSSVTPEPAAADDLPVLTDVIVADQLGPIVPPAIVRLEPTVHLVPPDPEDVERLAREMLCERLASRREAITGQLSAWIDDQLPQVVLRVIDGLADQIIAQVTAEAMATLLPRIQAALDESQPSQDAG